MSAKKIVSFPELMDSYGINLTKVLTELKKDTLKPALILDISRNVQLLWNFQQLMTVMYNVNVQNYDVLMNRIVAVEQKITKLEDKITCLEKEERLSIKTIIKGIEENDELRQKLRKLLL